MEMGRLCRLWVVAGGDLCPGRLVIVAAAVKVRELLAIVLLILLGVVVVRPDDVLGGLCLRSLRFWGPRSQQRNVLGDRSQ